MPHCAGQVFVRPPSCACCIRRPAPLQTARGDGLQQEAEWLAYASLLRNLSAAGVSEQLVWDVPGAPGVKSAPRRGML